GFSDSRANRTSRSEWSGTATSAGHRPASAKSERSSTGPTEYDRGEAETFAKSGVARRCERSDAVPNGQACAWKTRLRVQSIRSERRLCGREWFHLRQQGEGSVLGQDFPRSVTFSGGTCFLRFCASTRL